MLNRDQKWWKSKLTVHRHEKKKLKIQIFSGIKMKTPHGGWDQVSLRPELVLGNKTHQQLFSKSYCFAFRQKGKIQKINFHEQLRPKQVCGMSEETLTDRRWRHANVREPQGENACGPLNALQNMAISTGHSQRAGGSGWLHPADHKTTTPADKLQPTAANTHSVPDCRMDKLPPHSDSFSFETTWWALERISFPSLFAFRWFFF